MDCDAALLLDASNKVTLLARGEARRLVGNFNVSRLVLYNCSLCCA